MIVWDEATMSTGIPMIDAQHKKLFKEFNDFSDAVAQRKGKEMAGELLDFLQFYAKWHFGQEENCMNEYKCPVAAQNKKAHAEFVKRFEKFYMEWQTGTITDELVHQSYSELENWLVNHVSRVDTHLRACVKSD